MVLRRSAVHDRHFGMWCRSAALALATLADACQPAEHLHLGRFRFFWPSMARLRDIRQSQREMYPAVLTERRAHHALKALRLAVRATRLVGVALVAMRPVP